MGLAGTVGLPHILMRSDSVGWSLFFIFLLYFSAPAYAAFASWTVLTDVIGKAENKLGLFDIVDKKDGLLAGLARLALRPARRRHDLLPAFAE